MTCQEFETMLTTKPFGQTTLSERMAAREHYLNCPRCESFVQEKVAAEMAKDPVSCLTKIAAGALLNYADRLTAAEDPEIGRRTP